MKVYFDNAATTSLDKEVLEAMLPYMQEHFGNPSSIHWFGRKVRAAVESARKLIAKYLNVSPSEIFFTSGGTEAINAALRCAVDTLKISRVISSKIEHHAVLHTLQAMEQEGKIRIDYVKLDKKGHVDLEELEELLASPLRPSPNGEGVGERRLVSLMHANNEIGSLLPMDRVGEMCKKYNALFHCDTTQTIAHYKLDLQNIPVDMANASAHKFHGPKGIGFMYLCSRIKFHPFIYGGHQERNMRGGTENVYGIVGMAKALEIAHRDMEKDSVYIQGLKNYMIQQLEKNIPDVQFNGDAKGGSLYTILNVSFPHTENAELLVYHLDIDGIAASSGSACTSGSNQPSHVLKEIQTAPEYSERTPVRFSFSKHNNKDEIDFCIGKLMELFVVKV